MVKNNVVDEKHQIWTAATVIDDAPLVLDGKLMAQELGIPAIAVCTPWGDPWNSQST